MNATASEPHEPAPDTSRADRGISFERAECEDAPLLRALHELSLATLAGDAYSPEGIHGLFATRDTAPSDMLAAGRMRIARRHGIVVGSAGWEPRIISGSPGAHVRSVFVHPLQTRQDIASALLRFVESEAVANGARRFSLAATLTRRLCTASSATARTRRASWNSAVD